MTGIGRKLAPVMGAFVLAGASVAPATAQFASFEETAATRWGAAVYGGGDIDSLGNFQVGLRVSYKLADLVNLARVSPEGGMEFRKNYVVAKIGGRGDTREFWRLSAFAGGGVLRIQDFTNSSGGSATVENSDESYYYYFGGKLRLPSLRSIPVLGRILGGLPLEGVSVFVSEEITGLENPDLPEHLQEFTVNEWYGYSLQFGVMIGSASGWSPAGK